jgi:DNA-binding Xre family transcriptional regulator
MGLQEEKRRKLHVSQKNCIILRKGGCMSKEIMEELGLRVGMLRRRKKLSQKALAEAIASSPTTVSNIEQGKLTGLHLDHLIGLAQVLETSPNELLGWKEPPHA